MQDAIIINKKDNVAIALSDLKKSDTVRILIDDEMKKIKLKDDIKFLHKFALKNFDSGEKILKYGNVIGAAIKEIKAGDHVHTHNIESLRG